MDNDIQKKLEKLRQAYAASLPAKIEEALAYFSLLHTGSEPARLHDFYRFMHNLHGSAGTYGYLDIAEIAGQLELQLKSFELEEPGVQQREAFQQRFDVLINLLSNARYEQSQLSHTMQGLTPALERIIYVLDNESGKTYYLEMSQFGYQIKLFTALSECFRMMTKKAPDVLIVNMDMLNDELSEGLQRYLLTHTDVLLLVSAREGSVENRLKAVRSGAQAYLLEPFTIEEMLSKIDDFFKVKKLDYNILIVDDSPEVAAYYALLLQQAGMTVLIISEPMKIDQSLVQFNPDLILMDMYMPDCNGLEVVSIIRQQENYASIPIVFLSSEEDREKQLKAMRLGVDDFISKSTRTDFLILSIINRVERYRLLRSLISRDSLTGVLNHSEIQHRLNVHLKEASRLGLPLCVVMIDLDHFKKVNDQYGHQMGDRVLKNLCLVLKKRLRASDDIGRLGGEEFLIILPNTDIDNAYNIINSLREQFIKIRYTSEGSPFYVTFSAGIAAYPAYTKSQTLIAAADSALYSAKNEGRNKVALAKTPFDHVV